MSFTGPITTSMPPERASAHAVEAALHVWADHQADPRVMFKRWTEAFLSAFDATHPSSPTERAAAILRDRFRTRPP